jgi:hypothetical protein
MSHVSTLVTEAAVTIIQRRIEAEAFWGWPNNKAFE